MNKEYQTRNTKPKTRNAKPKLTFWQIWNMSFGFLGIQFGFALQNANVSRIFENLGAEIDKIPILWIAAPVTGLIVQPIIGYWSDKTWNKLGRRKPFFLIGAILASLGLIIMPNSSALWMAAGTLWIMDASINISMEPFRAFVGDMLPSEQRTLGFSMQSFFIGTGAVAGSALPWILTNWLDISNVPQGNSLIPDSVRWSFYIGAIVFISSVLITVFNTKEYSPEKLKSFESLSLNQNKFVEVEKQVPIQKFLIAGFIILFLGLIITALVYVYNGDMQIYILAGILYLISILFFAVSIMKRKSAENSVIEIMTDLMTMPKTMVQLAVVQFFTWISLFSMWIYTTPSITSFHFGSTNSKSDAYNEGADWVGVLFGAYNLFAAMVAFLLPVIAKRISRKLTHLFCLALGGMGLISMLFIKNPDYLLISMVGVGIGWASILSMPYAMLTSALPANKMGIYMGIFNFFIVLPQILAATFLGSITKHFFDGNSIYTIALGGVSMIIAGVFTLCVDDKDDPYSISKKISNPQIEA